MKLPNHLHLFTKISLFIIIAFSFFVFWNVDRTLAINNCNDGWQINVSQTKQIDCRGVCKKVTNSCSKGIFVPTKTSNEWADFRSNRPACISLSSCVVPKPDLIITDNYFSSDKHVHYSIKNQGSASAGASYSRLYVNGSSKTTDYVSSMSSGSTRSEYFSGWTCSAGASYTIKVCADTYNDVAESNEGNNCRTETLTCPGSAPSCVSILNSASGWDCNTECSLHGKTCKAISLQYGSNCSGGTFAGYYVWLNCQFYSGGGCNTVMQAGYMYCNPLDPCSPTQTMWTICRCQ